MQEGEEEKNEKKKRRYKSLWGRSFSLWLDLISWLVPWVAAVRCN
jgi:hypothetical protein